MERKHVHWLIFFLVILYARYSAQAQTSNSSELLVLYINQRFGELKEQVNRSGSYPSTAPELLFFQSLFIENGDEALKNFDNIFNHSSGWLHALSAKKIAEYYYAKGFYISAEKYKETYNSGSRLFESPAVIEQTTDTRSETPFDANFFIQVGAFSLRENAGQLQTMLKTQKIESKIVERTVDEVKLYCVWIEGTKDFDETNKYAEKLKFKYNLQYRVLKP